MTCPKQCPLLDAFCVPFHVPHEVDQPLLSVSCILGNSKGIGNFINGFLQGLQLFFDRIALLLVLRPHRLLTFWRAKLDRLAASAVQLASFGSALKRKIPLNTFCHFSEIPRRITR